MVRLLVISTSFYSHFFLLFAFSCLQVINDTVVNMPSDQLEVDGLQLTTERQVSSILCVHELPCRNDCSGRGVCVAGVCHCDNNFVGSSCNQLQCGPLNCSSHGTCTPGFQSRLSVVQTMLVTFMNFQPAASVRQASSAPTVPRRAHQERSGFSALKRARVPTVQPATASTEPATVLPVIQGLAVIKVSANKQYYF